MSDATPQTEPAEYAVVEIKGHRRLAGRILEVERFGAKMIRIDVPTDGDFDKGFVSQFYSAPAIFSVTNTDLETVRKINKPYERPRLMSSSEFGRAAGFLDPDPDDGEEPRNEDEQDGIAGHCESCSRALKPGENGHRDRDGVVLCEEHAPTWADERIPHLLQTPAAVRFLSCEPFLGPLDLYNGDPDPRLGGHVATKTYLGDWWERDDPPKAPSRHGVDWVIVGGESGPRARPMHPDWARSLRDQCQVAEVPFFFKQWGEHAPSTAGTPVQIDGRIAGSPRTFDQVCADRSVAWMAKVGKKAAGRLLDGVEHNGMPDMRP